MNTKIIEWSRRFINWCARACHRKRWYSADVPNINVTVTEYSAVLSPAGSPRSAELTEIRLAPLASEISAA